MSCRPPNIWTGKHLCCRDDCPIFTRHLKVCYDDAVRQWHDYSKRHRQREVGEVKNGCRILPNSEPDQSEKIWRHQRTGLGDCIGLEVAQASNFIGSRLGRYSVYCMKTLEGCAIQNVTMWVSSGNIFWRWPWLPQNLVVSFYWRGEPS